MLSKSQAKLFFLGGTFLFHRLEQVRRMDYGDEPDLEAMIDRFADRKAGRTPPEKIYISKRKRIKNLSLLILADLSLSSDAWSAGRKILEIEKEAILVFGEN